MLPGPPLSDLMKPTSLDVRIESVLGRQTLALDLPAQNVVIDSTSSRTVPNQLTFDVPFDSSLIEDRGAIANKGQRVHVWSLLKCAGSPYEIDLGWFQIEKWTPQDKGRSLRVTALDLMRTLETDMMKWPSSPPAGSTLRSELQRLAGSLPILLETNNRSIPTSLQWDRDRVKSIKDLCDSYNLEYGVQPDGYLHVWERRTGRTRVATYSAKDLLVDATRESGERLPNRFLAVGSRTEGSGDKAKEVRFAYEAAATFPPYGSDYGIVREVQEISSATSQMQVTNAANQALSDSLIATSTRPLEIVLDPRLELGDVIGVFPNNGEPFTGRIVAMSKPLTSPKSTMRVDVEVLLW